MYTIYYTDEQGSVTYREKASDIRLEDNKCTIRLTMPDGAEKINYGCDPSRYHILSDAHAPDIPCEEVMKSSEEEESRKDVDAQMHRVMEGVTAEDITDYAMDAELFIPKEGTSRLEEIIQTQDEYISALKREIEQLKGNI